MLLLTNHIEKLLLFQLAVSQRTGKEQNRTAVDGNGEMPARLKTNNSEDGK